MQTAIAKRGVSVVTLPGDVGLREAVEQQPRVHFREPNSHVRPSDDEIAVLAKILNESEKVTILGGAGCAGAHAELIELAGKLNAPIVHALRGKEFIEYDNPFDVGMTGLLGFTSGYHAMMNCTTLLMIGTDFPYQQFFPKQATVVEVLVHRQELSMPPTISLEQMKGFTLFTLKAVLSGRGDEIVDLAKINLFR